MPRFVGKQHKGAMKKLREKKRIDGELRNEEYQDRKKAAAKLAEETPGE